MTVDTLGDRFINHAPWATASDLVETIKERDGLAGASVIVERTGQRLGGDQTLGDADLRSGDILRISGDGPAAATPEGDASDVSVAPATLTMLSGPQTGVTFELSLGTNSVGRVSSNDVVLVDPSISRHHGSIEVKADHLSVSDNGSTNGIMVDDVHISQPTTLHSGQKILLGQSQAAIHLRSAAEDNSADQDLHFKPTPAMPRYEGNQVLLPRPPDPDGRAKRREFLIGGRNEHKHAVDQFERAFATLSEQLEAERQIERQARLAESPSLLQLVADLPNRATLWNRMAAEPGALDARIGIGTVASRTTFQPPGGGQQDLRTRLALLAEEYTAVRGAPATVDLRELGSVGIHGPMEQVRGLAYSLVGQLMLRLGPDQLGVALRPSARALEWDWLKWMPHGHFSGSASGLRDENFEAAITGLLNAELVAVDGRRPAMLVVIDDDRPLPVGVLTRLLDEGPGLGIYSLLLSGENAGFNHPLGAVVNVGPDRADLLLNNQVRTEGIALETATLAEMVALGRRIAPLRYAHDTDLPPRDDGGDDSAPVVIGPFEFGGPPAPGSLPEWRRDVPPPPPEIPLDTVPATPPSERHGPAAAVAAAAVAAAPATTDGDSAPNQDAAPAVEALVAPASEQSDDHEDHAEDEDEEAEIEIVADAAEPDTDTEPDTAAETDPDPDVAIDLDADTDTDADTDVEADVEVEAEADAEVGVEVDAEPVPDAPTMPERPLDIASLPHADEDFRLMLGTVSAPGLDSAAVFALNLVQDGVLALNGESGTGKTTALRSVAAAAGLVRLPADELPAVTYLDGGGDLAELASLDHAAGAGADNTDRLRSLVTDINWVITDRLQKIDALDVEEPTLEQYRALHPGERFRRIVVLVDDVKSVADLVDGPLPGDFEELFDRLLEHGQRVGVHLVFSVDERSDLDEERQNKVGRWLELGSSANGAPGQPGRAVVGTSEVRFAIAVQ